MKNINQLTDQEIKESIAAMESGLALNPGQNEREILEKMIVRAKTELATRAQKKSEAKQQSEQQIPQEIPEQTIQQAQKDVQRWVVGRQPEAPKSSQYETATAEIQAPAPQSAVKVKIALVGGKVKELDFSGTVIEGRRYFKAVMDSATFKKGGDIRTLDMGCNLIALYSAWVWFLNRSAEFETKLHPSIFDLFPSFNKFSEQNQEYAEKLRKVLFELEAK